MTSTGTARAAQARCSRATRRGGWAWVLSNLKTLLETGKGFAG
jgi:hypothetical protein